MVRGAIDDFLAMASVRVTRGASAGVDARWPNSDVQLRVAEASAKVDAARLLIERDLRDVEHAPLREAITIDQRIRNRRDQAFAVKLCAEAIDAMYAAVGGGGVLARTGFSRPGVT
jgi:alkylation response protein AidB-like acyl-CoA dehydrogenase